MNKGYRFSAPLLIQQGSHREVSLRLVCRAQPYSGSWGGQRHDQGQHVDTHFIDPGSPWQNGHNESLNGIFRAGCLDRWLLSSVHEARRIITNWLKEYNDERPHGVLNWLTPRAFVTQCSSQALEQAA